MLEKEVELTASPPPSPEPFYASEEVPNEPHLGATTHASGSHLPACPSIPSIPRSSRRERSNNTRQDTTFLKFNPTLVLENAGSVARDHLAVERTFLAYVRTSLTIATAGVGE